MALLWTPWIVLILLLGSLFGFGIAFLAILSYPNIPFVAGIAGIIFLALSFAAFYIGGRLTALIMLSIAAGAFFLEFMPILMPIL